MNEARHHDDGKPRLELLPPDVLVLIAQGFTYGAKKYAMTPGADDGAWNWTRGLRWSKLYASTLRHLTSWAIGEDIDEESGLPHLALAGCDLMMLAGHALRRIGTDDRHPVRKSDATSSADRPVHADEGVYDWMLDAESRVPPAPRTLPSSRDPRD